MKNEQTQKNKKQEGASSDMLEQRPPVVVVVGHVDHGKTKLLDYIRKTNIAEKEAGGITQHIGAYEIFHNGQKITFIDTPGHEAFSQMRSRGIKAADIAILVVAADDGVKPQTEEAINRLKEAEIPFVVALNKIDKPEANVNKSKQELAEHQVFVEGWGGTVPVQEVSALTGQGIKELLETIILLAELEELKASKNNPANGIVIESHMDSRSGPTFTCLITDGTIKVGDYMAAGTISGKVKSMSDFLGKPIKSASFSSPVVIKGMFGIPSVGEWCLSSKDKKYLEKMAQELESGVKKDKIVGQSGRQGKKILNLVLKTDVEGSLEALKKLVSDLRFKEVGVNIIKSESGDINESDVKTSLSSNAVVAGFRVKIPLAIERMAENMKVKIIRSDIIYELIELLKKELAGLLDPIINRNIVGNLEVLAVFKQEKDRIIVGGRVLSGKLKTGSLAEIFRGEESMGKGKIIHLQQDKKDTNEVASGNECGIKFSGFVGIKEGDKLEAYEEKKLERKLETE